MSVFDQTKKDVDTVINTLNSINFEELMKKIQLIGNQEKNIGEEYKQKLDNVLNFLSIKINK
jgi:hypothetical protein